MKRILAALVSAGLVLSGIALAPAAQAATSSATLKSEYSNKLNNYDYTKTLTRSSVRDSGVETWILGQVNNDRTRYGVGKVKRNSSLDTVAYNWSKKMAAANKISHNPSVSSQIPKGWQKWAENVAMNGTRPDSGTMLYYQWMTSDGHRANILDGAWTDMGIGIYIDSSGTFWGTQVFAKYPTASASKPQATISGFSTSKVVKPKTTVTWKNVKLSNAGRLQKLSAGKWVNVKNLASGTHNISLKASTSYNTNTSYRIITRNLGKTRG